MRKRRIGTAKFFTLLLLLYHTSAKAGGAKAVALTTAQLPAHSHALSGLTISEAGAHTHVASAGSYKVGSGSGSSYKYMTNDGATAGQATGEAGAHTHTLSGSVGSTGSGNTHSNLQPYITCYFWRRTA
jgi:microcystin-dependent protein